MSAASKRLGGVVGGNTMSGLRKVVLGCTALAMLCALAPIAANETALTPSLPTGSSASEPLFAIATNHDHIGRILAAVRINGQGPFRFMLDTGANRTVIAEHTLTALNLEADPAHLIQVTGVAGDSSVASVHVHSLDSGSLHFREADLPVLTGPVLDGIDGILGMDGVEAQKMAADFVNDRFSITQSVGRRAGLTYAVLPVRLVSQRILIADIEVGGVRTKAVIDTGGTHTLGNQALLTALRHQPGTRLLTVSTNVVDVTQQSQAGIIVRAPLVKLGPVGVSNLDVTFADFHVFDTWNLLHQPALLIGMDVLGSLAEFAIDYRRHELHMLLRPSITLVSQN